MSEASDRERFIDRSCRGKVRYSNRNHAKAGARNLKRHSGHKMTTYPCEHCGGFHICKAINKIR